MRKTVARWVLITLLALFLLACGETPLTEKQVAEAFLQAMEGREFLTAYELLSADSQATIATAEEFKTMLDQSWASAGIAGFKVESVQDPILATSGKRASVPYSASLTTNDGQTVTVYNALSLVRQDDEVWRVIWPPVR
ncbi:MAG: hypothetical protein JXA37_11170 [Chloroflexia bacterium]|nr:hypothetical protein [Chloroflexia bacterium]